LAARFGVARHLVRLTAVAVIFPVVAGYVRADDRHRQGHGGDLQVDYRTGILAGGAVIASTR
jgi:hypothetical protein